GGSPGSILCLRVASAAHRERKRPWASGVVRCQRTDHTVFHSACHGRCASRECVAKPTGEARRGQSRDGGEGAHRGGSGSQETVACSGWNLGTGGGGCWGAKGGR